jgi:hypothetical protein
MIEAYKWFFTHYGTQSIIGVQLQMSLELLTLEVGISPQPFLQDFSKHGSRATHGFLSALWEKTT